MQTYRWHALWSGACVLVLVHWGFCVPLIQRTLPRLHEVKTVCVGDYCETFWWISETETLATQWDKGLLARCLVVFRRFRQTEQCKENSQSFVENKSSPLRWLVESVLFQWWYSSGGERLFCSDHKFLLGQLGAMFHAGTGSCHSNGIFLAFPNQALYGASASGI